MSIDNAMDRLRAANPAPDTRLLRAELDDLNVRLSATWQRSTNVQTQIPQETQQSEKPTRRGWLIAAAAFAVVVIVGLGLNLVATSNDSPPAVSPAVPITIVTQSEFDNGIVFGTFEVTEAADALGCSSGTFKDSGVDFEPDNDRRVFTCESGSNSGTFSAIFNVLDDPASVEGESSGYWSLEPSDDFVSLQGDGDWFAVWDQPGGVGPVLGVETWTGDISYTP